MPWAALPPAPLPVFEGSGDAPTVPSRAIDEERRADDFPPATRSVSPQIRGICSISKREVHQLSSVGFLGLPSICYSPLRMVVLKVMLNPAAFPIFLLLNTQNLGSSHYAFLKMDGRLS